MKPSSKIPSSKLGIDQGLSFNLKCETNQQISTFNVLISVECDLRNQKDSTESQADETQT